MHTSACFGSSIRAKAFLATSTSFLVSVAELRKPETELSPLLREIDRVNFSFWFKLGLRQKYVFSTYSYVYVRKNCARHYFLRSFAIQKY